MNDKDGFVSNVYRALQSDPETVAKWCDFPVDECMQHAVHTWLLTQRDTLTARLMGDPDYYDAQIAGRWLYGICCWIGSGWCSGDGPWQSVEGQLVHLGNAGKGVHRKRVHLGNAGQGVHRKLVHLGNAGQGGLYEWFATLQARLRHVRVCCGDWSRVVGPSVTYKHGLTGMLLDPPYAIDEDRHPTLYRVEDLTVAHAVREWCLVNGANPLLRIVLCGYGETHDELLAQGWSKTTWVANGGYGNQHCDGNYQNKYRETLWMSPACCGRVGAQQMALFAAREEPPW